MSSIPDLDQRGFVRVDCAACGQPGVWLRCEACGKSDHFLLDAEAARCACGATWGHARCLCGATVPIERLRFTPFKEGPMALADLEWDPRRLALFALGALALLGALAALALR